MHDLLSKVQHFNDNEIKQFIKSGPAGIEYDLFKKLYTYLAEVDGNITQEHIESVLAYLDNDAAKNTNMIGPAHFTHAFCPKLSG